MLADGSAVSFCDSCNCVAVCIITEGRNLVVFGPCVEHGHSHTVIVRNYNVNLIAERRGPCSDCVSCCSCIPGSSCGVLHFLRSKFAYHIFLAAYFDFTVLYHGCCSVCIGACRIAVDIAVFVHAGSESLTNASGTCDGVIMSDITDCQNITDGAVAVAVNLINVSFNVFFYHSSLKFCALVSVKPYIICIGIEVQSCHIQFSCGAVGRLTVKPYQGLIFICSISGCSCIFCTGVFSAVGICCRLLAVFFLSSVICRSIAASVVSACCKRKPKGQCQSY